MNKLNENYDYIFTNIQSELKKGVINRNHGFHTPVFSNISKNGKINSRIIVLRRFNSLSMKINFHSDIRSKKINDIKLNPETGFLFYDNKIKIQLRITTKSLIHYKDKITQQAWDKVILSSRKCYLTQQAPSSCIDNPGDGLSKHLLGINPTKDESKNGYNNFAVISNKIDKIEWLCLSSSGHRRLLIKIDSKNNYQWLIP